MRSDSPTAGKETLKIALSIAANEGFDIKSIDIKSAYLQGHDLKRDIFVKPPVEAEVPGKLWKLKKAAYGILDGGRLFYLRLEEVLSNLGMHKAHADGAMFSYVKSGKLHGLIASHVDDLFIAGDKVFRENVESKLADIFKFSKVECNSFKYCGCTISKTNAGIIVDQQEYVENLEPIDVDVATEDLDRSLSQAEIKMLRGRIGEVLWISLITRPDLSFDVNRLSSEISTATLKTILDMNKLIVKAKSREASLKFSKLGDVKDLKVKVFTDASFNNQDCQVRSTAGKIVLIENSKSGKVNVISWKTKKIQRVCRSVKAAETRALDDGLDEAVNVARIVKEIYTGTIDLKCPDQLPVVAMTDSKSVWENVYNSRQCEEKILRNTIAAIKELVENGMVEAVNWVPTDKQLADCLTKKGSQSKADWLLNVMFSNSLNPTVAL